ncbi:hypothetical protein CPC08DRAFT_242814 [Agrocybe pediades]|nr:hypothetical protein CPC08DRAFT_242814 [Agrocybe pediades]
MRFTTTAAEDLKVQANVVMSISVCKYGPGDQQRRYQRRSDGMNVNMCLRMSRRLFSFFFASPILIGSTLTDFTDSPLCSLYVFRLMTWFRWPVCTNILPPTTRTVSSDSDAIHRHAFGPDGICVLGLSSMVWASVVAMGYIGLIRGR